MKRTQARLTKEHDIDLGQLGKEGRISHAGVASAADRAIIPSTAGLCADYSDSPEWQRQVRGRTAAERLGELP